MELDKPCEKHKMNKLLENSIDIPMDMFRSTMKTDDKCSSSVERPDNKKLNNSSSINGVVTHSLFRIDETKESTRRQNICCTFAKRYKILFWVERILLFCFCAAIAGGFTVPIIIFAVDTDLGNTTELSSDLDFGSCSDTAAQVCNLNDEFYT